VRVHNWVGFALIANYFVWLLFYLFSDKIKVYHPELDPAKHFRNTLKQLQYYGYGIFKGQPNPHHVSLSHKFNPLQSVAYQVIMILLVPIQFYTGLLLWDLERFAGSVALFGGVRVVDTVHVALFVFFTAFIFIHPYLASLGHTPSAHFKAMLTGYEELE
jgi:thiosulfate reductase cytochrome b subunit